MDIRPLYCRFRLQDEGRVYPKSSCGVCKASIVTGLGKECKYTNSNEVLQIGILYYLKTDLDKNPYVLCQVGSSGVFLNPVHSGYYNPHYVQMDVLENLWNKL